jgi:hypothetical protein
MSSFLNKTIFNTYTNVKLSSLNFFICLQLDKDLKPTQQMFSNSFINSSFFKSSKIKIKSPLYLKTTDEKVLPDFKTPGKFFLIYSYKNLYFIKNFKNLDLSFIKLFKAFNNLLNFFFICFIKKIIIYNTTNIVFNKYKNHLEQMNKI